MLSSRKAVKFLFGMAVAGALGFGATGATAAVNEAAACPAFNLATGNVGSCTSATQCQSTCLGYYPQNGGVSNNCRNGCCLCAV
jgi:hypothetical protein